MNKRKLVIITLGGLLLSLGVIYLYKTRYYANHKPNYELIKTVQEKVIVTFNPPIEFSYDLMTEGVTQHLDRIYTYDYIPEELQNVILFQGTHRIAIGTTVTINLLQPTTIYVFFHELVDSGYTSIFEKLEDWNRCTDAPKYDILNGNHGLNMIMYKMEAKPGRYTIPATTSNEGCFNLAFKF